MAFEFNEPLNRRQILLLGEPTVHQLRVSEILIYGLDALGREIAENLVLAGLTVSLCDDDQENGVPRAVSCCNQLLKHAETRVSVIVEQQCRITEADYLSKFKTVVICKDTVEMEKIDESCRNASIACVIAHVAGVTCTLAVCGGGKRSKSSPIRPPVSMIASISNASNALVSVPEDHPHGLFPGDTVTFSDIQGMEALNSTDPVSITEVEDDFSFMISLDTSSLPPHEIGTGYVLGTRKQTPVFLEPLSTSLKPFPGHENERVCPFYDTIASSVPPSPLATAWLSGIASQNVISLITGYGEPLIGSFCSEMSIFDIECKPAKVLIVGAGACGSAVTKCLVDIGFDDICVVDGANISDSCVNRSKLYGSIGGTNKAATVAEYSKPTIQFKDRNLDEQFDVSEYGCIVSCTNGKETKSLIESKCIFNRIPLVTIEAYGCSGSCVSMTPFQSCILGNQSNSSTFPPCVVTSFPTIPAHAIKWASTLFDMLFVKTPSVVNHAIECSTKFCDIPNKEDVIDALSLLSNRDPIAFITQLFTHHFHTTPSSLIDHFPKSARKSDGSLFWAGKRYPMPIELAVGDATHVTFCVFGAKLWGRVIGVDVSGEAVRARMSEKREVEERKIDESILSETLRGMAPFPVLKLEDDEMITNFLVSAAHLRCMSYSLPCLSHSETVGMCLGDVPAISTTYSVLGAVGAAQVTSILAGNNGLCYAFNLSTSTFLPYVPAPPEPGIWDMLFLDARGCSLKQFLEMIRETHGYNVTIMTHGTTIIYSEFLAPKKLKERFDMQVTSLLGGDYDYCPIEIMCEDEEGEEVDVPRVRVRVR